MPRCGSPIHDRKQKWTKRYAFLLKMYETREVGMHYENNITGRGQAKVEERWHSHLRASIPEEISAGEEKRSSLCVDWALSFICSARCLYPSFFFQLCLKKQIKGSMRWLLAGSTLLEVGDEERKRGMRGALNFPENGGYKWILTKKKEKV